MCGIAGIARTGSGTAAPDAASVARMSAALAHRGPDDAGAWSGGGVAFAHRRLSVLDVSRAGHQPMSTADGRYTVVFNGEIYNFAALRKELEARGVRFHTQCDTEVLLEAYRAWGDASVHRFNGMFAFALYDRDLERLVLVRDRLGVKPLFYTVRNGFLAFASELGALVESGLVEGRVNPGALDAFFTFLYIPAPDTIYEGVHKLRPGERLILEKDDVRLERYWEPVFAPQRDWTLDTAADRLMELLTDSVRLRQISDVPLGTFLSGGLDSSTVTALLAHMSAAPIKTFTIGFEDAAADELAYARAVAERFGTDHTEAVLRPDAVALAPRIARHFGEPFADSSALPTWLVSEVARRGVTVALSGDGGDELFAGYTWLRMNRAVARYRRVPRALRAAVGATLRMFPASPRLERLLRFEADSFLTPMGSFRRRLTCFSDAERGRLYTSALAEALERRTADRFEEHVAAGAGLGMDEQMLRLDTAMYLPDDILAKVDRMSMAHGLEAREPLLDYRLAEFAGTLPFALKLGGGRSKRLLKHAMRTALPREALAERKRGFAVPIQRWFRESLHAHFVEMVLSPEAHSGRFLRSDAVRSLLASHESGKCERGHHLWAILMFEHWLRSVDERMPIFVE